MDTPWEDLSEEVRDTFLYGTNGERIYVSYRNRYGRKRSYMTRFEGIVNNLERRYRETDSEWSREKIEEYMSVRPCPDCHGARLRPESLAVKVGGLGIHRAHRHVGATGDRVVRLARADRHRAPDRAADPARDRRATAVPRQRRGRLPVARAGRLDAVGRRGAADPAGNADRVEPGGRALHPRRALDRPAPARQRAPDLHPGAAARPRQHGHRGGARRGHDARGRPLRGPRSRGRRARRRAGGRGPPGGRDGGAGVAHGPVPVGRGLDPGPPPAPPPRRLPGDRGRVAAQPSRRGRQGAARHVLLRHGRVGLGQVDARQRGAAQGGGQPPAPGQAAARRSPAHQRPRPDRQDHQHRPVARSVARRARTRPPTSGSSTRSATSSRARRRRARAATSRAGSRST